MTFYLVSHQNLVHRPLCVRAALRRSIFELGNYDNQRWTRFGFAWEIELSENTVRSFRAHLHVWSQQRSFHSLILRWNYIQIDLEYQTLTWWKSYNLIIWRIGHISIIVTVDNNIMWLRKHHFGRTSTPVCTSYRCEVIIPFSISACLIGWLS